MVPPLVSPQCNTSLEMIYIYLKENHSLSSSPSSPLPLSRPACLFLSFSLFPLSSNREPYLAWQQEEAQEMTCRGGGGDGGDSGEQQHEHTHTQSERERERHGGGKRENEDQAYQIRCSLHEVDALGWPETSPRWAECRVSSPTVGIVGGRWGSGMVAVVLGAADIPGVSRRL
ncbi:hypothetical protein CH063_12620, partial [Colletotrichum higginsianum]